MVSSPRSRRRKAAPRASYLFVPPFGSTRARACSTRSALALSACIPRYGIFIEAEQQVFEELGVRQRSPAGMVCAGERW
jgi:hypothetical protein